MYNLLCSILVLFFVALTSHAKNNPEIQLSSSSSEILKQFEKFLSNKESSEKPIQQKKYDKNFDIIDKGVDSFEKNFSQHRELLGKIPDDLSSIECISKSISERKILFNTSIFQDTSSVDSVISSLNDIKKQHEKIYKYLEQLKVLLQCIDTIMCNNSVVISFLKQQDNTKSLLQNDIDKIFAFVAPIMNYSSDELQIFIKSLFYDSLKTNFENQQNIPSFYLFNLLKHTLDKLQNVMSSVTSMQFNRSFENAIYSMQKLCDDINSISKSDQIAQNILPFLSIAKKTISFQMSYIQKKSNELKDYLATIDFLGQQLKKTIEKFLATEKDLSVFESDN